MSYSSVPSYHTLNITDKYNLGTRPLSILNRKLGKLASRLTPERVCPTFSLRELFTKYRSLRIEILRASYLNNSMTRSISVAYVARKCSGIRLEVYKISSFPRRPSLTLSMAKTRSQKNGPVADVDDQKIFDRTPECRRGKTSEMTWL